MSSSLFEKLSTIKTHPLEVSKKIIKHIYHRIETQAEDLLYVVSRILLYGLPVRSLAKLKNILNPIVRLDYHQPIITLYADSELSIYRAQACRKEPETIAWIEKYIKPDEVLYDVGANVGAYSLVASKYFDNRITVHAFEPSFSTYYQLTRNILLNGCQHAIHPHLMVLSDKTGPVVFNYKSLEGGSADHVLSQNSISNLKEKLAYSQKLIGYRIDDLVNEYDFVAPNHIKLDVDGSELNVLKGAIKTFESGSIKSILVEVRTTNNIEKNITDFLLKFDLKLVDRHDRGNGIIWNDIFAKDAF